MSKYVKFRSHVFADDGFLFSSLSDDGFLLQIKADERRRTKVRRVRITPDQDKKPSPHRFLSFSLSIKADE